MRRRFLRHFVRLILLSLLVGSLPGAAFAEPRLDPPPPDVLDQISPPLTVAPAVDPQLPSLIRQLVVAPDSVPVGDTAAFTLTIANEAEHPARALTITLPTPEGALALDGDGFVGLTQGWQWTLPLLEGHAQTTFTGSFRLVRMPGSGAVLFVGTIAAAGLDQPLVVQQGALAADRANGPANAAFAPGQAARLTSADGSVIVDVPGNAFGRALTLRHTPRLARADAGGALPPRGAGVRRALDPFFLEASDDAGTDVHQFAAPLTIQVAYTPEQLAARGLDATDLTLFWFDETATATTPDGQTLTGRWQALSTNVDPIAQTATAQVDHFTPFALGDGSSPSTAFVPSLQGWQVSMYTGAASYSYPIDVPAGPAGLKPSLSLSYSSGATDGKSGLRQKQQAGWVGLGWSLDTGSIAATKLPNEKVYYSLALNGQSFDLVRGAALVGSPVDGNPSHWDWTPLDKSYLTVRAVDVGPSTSSRGGFQGANAYRRYKWQIWTKDGTLYEFAEDMWWGWEECPGYAYLEPNKWALSSVTDTNGNTISYTYGRLSRSVTTAPCFAVTGTVDQDLWPDTITWAGGRYRVRFVSTARVNDTAFDGASNQFEAWGDAPHQMRRLDSIVVESKVSSSWERVRQYDLGYDYSLGPDLMDCNPLPCVPDISYARLTLKSIQLKGNNGTTALPATTFGYGAFSVDTVGSTYWIGGSWNRLTTVNNNQGGTLTFAYENIGKVTGSNLMSNQRRVISKTVNDGIGSATTWTYSYGTPNVNSLGSSRGSAAPTWWYSSDWGATTYPNSAALYYNAFSDISHDNRDWLSHRQFHEFRGHNWVVESVPGGGPTKHFFRQGEASDQCAPTATGTGMISDPCFQRLRDGEFLKGREYKTQVFAIGANPSSATPLQETTTTTGVLFSDYGPDARSGLWRAFTAETQVDAITKEAQGSNWLTKTTKTYYNPNCTIDTLATVDANYGNVGCIEEYAGGVTPVRTTKRWFVFQTSTPPIVDRIYQEAIYDTNGYVRAITNQFYDGATHPNTAPTEGNLTRVGRVYNIPNNVTTTGTTQGVNTTYHYDTYGNQDQVTVYTGTSDRNGTTGAWTAPGGTARTTTTTFDPIFHALPVTQVNAATQTTQADYDDRMGTLTSVTDPNNATTSAVYDVFGRMAKLIKPGDSTSFPTVEWVYNDTEIPVRYVTRQREVSNNATYRATQTFYDGVGQAIQTKLQSGRDTQGAASQVIITDTEYDGLGRVTKTSQPRYVSQSGSTYGSYTNPGASLFNPTSTAYDGLGRALTVTQPGSRTTTMSYALDGTGARTTTIDDNNHKVDRWADALGRLIQVREYTGSSSYAPYATTNYTYDDLDQLTLVKDAANNETKLEYDSLGRKTKTTDRDMGVWTYGYDGLSNLTSQTDAKAQTITFGYDALSRLTSKQLPGGWASWYAYDETFGAENSKGIGHRTSISTTLNGTGKSYARWTYDARGRVTLAGQHVHAAGISTNLLYTYDAADRLVTQNYSEAGETVTTAYDVAWRPVSLCTSLSATCYVTNATYTALNQPDAWTLGNGVAQDWQYDSTTARLSRLKVGSGTPASLFDRSYGYDGVDNVLSITDNKAATNNQSFTYDDLNRLNCWKLNSTSCTESYAYNTIGNLTSKAGVSYSYPASGANSTRPHTPSSVGGQAYTYDNNGNLTADGTRTYTWTAENLPNTITYGSTTESFTYDADNERVAKTVGSTTTVYFAGLWEQVVGGARKLYYTFNGQVIAVRDSVSGLAYLHGDHLGSVSVATNSAGALLSTQEFDPWGKVRTGSMGQTTLNYTGQRLDGSGLLYYHARMYNPVIGRFVSADSVVPDPSNPQQFNRYTYVLNNPLRYTDPSGHAHCDGVACQREGGGGGGGGGGGAIPAPNLKQLAAALATAATAVIAYLTGQGNNKPATPAQSDTGGQAASQGGMDPDEDDQGKSVRNLLRSEYEQKYGESDAAIRKGLGIKGRTADFVGYNSKSGRWLVAESKGGDFDSAFKQLTNTVRGLIKDQPGSAGSIDLRIYTNANQFSKLGSEGVGGWRISGDGFLGWLDEYGAWNYAEVNGIKISVLQAP